jgi:hypothetical protein
MRRSGERWTVTGADPDAQALTNQVPTPGTISTLTALPVPPVLPPNGRSDGAEKTLWSVQAALTAYAAEADGDCHMVIADQAGRTMLAEIPKPGDIRGRSYFAAEIANARRAFDDRFQITDSPNQPTPTGTGSSPFRDVRIGVALLGLGFFDFDHNQRGLAPNGIELHPVASIVFNPSGGRDDPQRFSSWSPSRRRPRSRRLVWPAPTRPAIKPRSSCWGVMTPPLCAAPASSPGAGFVSRSWPRTRSFAAR